MQEIRLEMLLSPAIQFEFLSKKTASFPISGTQTAKKPVASPYQ
jgi:hypothetical protein